MSGGELRISRRHSAEELQDRDAAVERLRACPIPDAELMSNLGIFLSRQTIARQLFFTQLYEQILPVHGSIMEFGVRWGRDLVLMQALRGILEPWNYTRRIVGFDTFEGFPSVHDKDGSGDIAAVGSYAVTEGYEHYLAEILDGHERESPLAHIRKHELVTGDVAESLPRYLEEHPETVVAFAYFDLDIYEPTVACLKALRPHVTRGTVIGFDEVSHPDFPGETLALREAWGLDSVRLQRSPVATYPSWFVVE